MAKVYNLKMAFLNNEIVENNLRVILQKNSTNK